MSGVPRLGIQPSDDGAAAARPQRVVGVKAKLQVMRAKAGVDELIVLRFGIEDGDLAHISF